jgi:hypothetical protein
MYAGMITAQIAAALSLEPRRPKYFAILML